MALRPCSECGKDISTEAKACPHCGKQNPTGAKTSPVAIGCLALLALGIISSLFSSNSDTSSRANVGSVPVASAPVVDTAQQRITRESWMRDSVQMVTRLAALKKRFRFDKDEVEGGGWYGHQNQTVDNSWDRSYLEIHVADDGRTYLSSHYYGDSWIFHERVIVRIRDRVLQSDEIPSYDKRNVRHNSGGSVWESLHLTAAADNGILEAIAADSTSPVRVRLDGKRDLHDFVLAARDRKAIRDGRELGCLIRGLAEHRRC